MRAIAGFGPSARLHTGKVLRLSSELPIIIEAVDTAASERVDDYIAAYRERRPSLPDGAARRMVKRPLVFGAMALASVMA